LIVDDADRNVDIPSEANFGTNRDGQTVDERELATLRRELTADPSDSALWAGSGILREPGG
jgi:hypothetical protein